MKKVIFFRVLIAFLFVVLVGVLPTVCAFIPYGEPTVVDDKVNASFVQGSEAKLTLQIDVNNSTMVKITSMGFAVEVLRKGWEEDIDNLTEDNALEWQDKWIVGYFESPVEFKANISFFGKGSLETVINLVSNDWVVNDTTDFEIGTPSEIAQSIANGEYEIVFIDGYFSYEKLDPYWYYVFGLILFFIVTLFFTKQKFYFEVDGNKIEVFASLKNVALIVNGEVIENKDTKNNKENTIVYNMGENEIKITIGRPVIMPNVKIKVNGKDAEFKKVKIHSFLKMQDKKKGAF